MLRCITSYHDMAYCACFQDDAEKEAEQKSFCDKAMKAAVSKRDANQAHYYYYHEQLYYCYYYYYY